MPKTTKTFRLDEALIQRMDAYAKETGVPPSEQVRRALPAWLSEQEKYRAQMRRSLMARTGGTR